MTVSFLILEWKGLCWSWGVLRSGDADVRHTAEAALVDQLDGKPRRGVFVRDDGDGAVFVRQLFFYKIWNLLQLVWLVCVADFAVFGNGENHGLLWKRLGGLGLRAVDAETCVLCENGRDHEEYQQQKNHIDHGGHVDVRHGVGLRVEMTVTHGVFSDGGGDGPWRGSLEWRRRGPPGW